MKKNISFFLWRFSLSECPDKICMKEGFIDKPGQSIICLPFRIVVEIQGVKNVEVDQVTY
nr:MULTISPECIES: NusG domain II-containing protein [Caldanaerobacter]